MSQIGSILVAIDEKTESSSEKQKAESSQRRKARGRSSPERQKTESSKKKNHRG